MKLLLSFGLLSLLFTSATFGAQRYQNYPMEEAFFIHDADPKVIQLLNSRPELTIDHVKPSGFELYGPRGLEAFLQKNKIKYSVQNDVQDFTKGQYPTPEEIELTLKDISKKFSAITKLYSIGKSVKKRDLWVMKLSENANNDDDKPAFKYIANMHGDEIVGRELMVKFIKDCTENYGKDPAITNIFKKYQVHILVSMNPDGAALGIRGNGNRIDLNRDFPDFSTEDNSETLEGRQPETQAVMKWQRLHNFRLSANFHGGAEVVNYPWDTVPDSFPQESLVKEISREYALNAPYINASTAFENGITNGYAWYEVNGGMQDWSIYYNSDLQITVELSDKKWPDYSKVNYYYEQNRPALIKLIERIETL